VRLDESLDDLDETLEGFDGRLVEADERLDGLDERLIELIERLKTRNGRGLAAWELRSRGSLKAERTGRPPRPRPPPSAYRGGPAFRKSMPLIAEREYASHHGPGLAEHGRRSDGSVSDPQDGSVRDPRGHV
jgi:hypothetical protein